MPIERVRLLDGHVSPETAYVVDDYPYGFVLRCKIRYWIETASKGAKRGMQRFVSQTTNPKRPGEPWNKPKTSGYNRLVFMYLDSDDRMQWFGVSEYGVTPEADAKLRHLGIVDQMNADDRAFYRLLVQDSQMYADPWERWESQVSEAAELVKSGGNLVIEDNEFFSAWVRPSGQVTHVGGPGVFSAEVRERVEEG